MESINGNGINGNGNGNDGNDEVMVTAMEARSILVSVEVHTFGVRRKIDAERATVDGNSIGDDAGEISPQMIAVTKKLLSSEELNEVSKKDREFYSMMMTRVISSRFRKGSYLLPITLLDWFEEEFSRYTGERARLVEAFLNVYDEQVVEAQKKLGPLFDQGDYPSVDRVREKFGVERAYQTVGVPDKLAEINPTLFEAQRSELRRKTAEAAEEVRLVLRAGLLQLAEKLAEKLTPDADGKKKRLHESTVESLRQWLDLFDHRNITADAELADTVGVLRQIMDGVDVDVLRSSEPVKETVGRLLESQIADLEVMVEKKERRRAFRF